jgi:PAS domain-containing protein
MFDVDYMFKENNYSGVVILLDKNLNIKRFNGNFGKLQGYKENDIYNKPFIDIIVPEDKPLFLDATYTIDNSKDFTVQCYHKQGAFRYYSFSMINLKEYKLLFGKVIKKEFKSYKYVNESQNYLERAFDKLDVDDISDIIAKDDKNLGIFLSTFPIDIWIKDRYNRYIFVNEVFTGHTGHTLDDVYLRDDFQLFPRDVAKGFTNSDNEAISKGKKINYVFYAELSTLLTWTEVTKIPLYNINKEYIGLLGFSSDVTESRLIESNLNSIIDKYELVISKMDVLVVEINSEGTATFAGGKLLQKFGINENEILTKNIFEVNKNNPAVNERIKSVYKGKKDTIYIELFNENLKIDLQPYFAEKEVTSIIAIASIIGGNKDE